MGAPGNYLPGPGCLALNLRGDASMSFISFLAALYHKSHLLCSPGDLYRSDPSISGQSQSTNFLSVQHTFSAHRLTENFLSYPSASPQSFLSNSRRAAFFTKQPNNLLNLNLNLNLNYLIRRHYAGTFLYRHSPDR